MRNRSCTFFMSSTQMTPDERVRTTFSEHGAAHQPEVAVHVAQVQAENPAHERVVNPSDDLPMQGSDRHLVSIDEVDVGREGLVERVIPRGSY